MELKRSFKELNTKTTKEPEKKEAAKPESKFKNRYPFLLIRKDEAGNPAPAAVKFLHGLDKSVDLSVHNIFENRSFVNYLCEMYWKDECQFCKNKNYIKSVKCILSAVVSLMDKDGNPKTWQITNSNGEVLRSGPYQVIRITTIPLGRNSANIEPLKVAHDENFLLTRMWLLSKSPKLIKDKTAFVLNPPKILYPKDYKEVMGEAMPEIKIPKSGEDIGKMTEDEIFKAIVGSFENGEKLLEYLNSKGQDQLIKSHEDVPEEDDSSWDDRDLF